MSSENAQTEFVTDCSSTEEFIRRYYKRLDRDITTWGKSFLGVKVASYNKEIAEYGYALISSHDSVTGRVVKFKPDYRQDPRSLGTVLVVAI